MKYETALQILNELQYADKQTKKTCRQVLEYLNLESIYVSFITDAENGTIYIIAEGLLSKSSTCMFIISIDETTIKYCYKIGKLRKYNTYKKEGVIDISQLESTFEFLLYRE